MKLVSRYIIWLDFVKCRIILPESQMYSVLIFVDWIDDFDRFYGLELCNGAKKLLCGNVRNFSMAKNGYAHRVQHTRISLGPNFGASSSLIFKDF